MKTVHAGQTLFMTQGKFGFQHELLSFGAGAFKDMVLNIFSTTTTNFRHYAHFLMADGLVIFEIIGYCVNVI